MNMIVSVACSVRNGSRLWARTAGLSVFANRPLHGSVKGANCGARGTWARARAGLLAPQQRLVQGECPTRELSLSPDDAPETPETDPKEVEEVEEEVKFGTLSASFASRRFYKKSSPLIMGLRFRDDDEERPGAEEKVKQRKRTNTEYWYFLQCKKLIKENKLQEALDLFHIDMLKAERLQPKEFNYSVLIGGCGRAGKLKLAFKLYNDMKKRGLEASDATFTALFNACAESPFKEVGLKFALKLEQELRCKNFSLNTRTYQALLKVHAVTNHLQPCLDTLREMLKNGHVATPDTFHHLLMACVRDKEQGFRLALQIWRQMVKAGLLPGSKSYTLLLRAARDCGIGDSALASAVLLSPVEEPRRKTKKGTSMSVRMVDLLEEQLFNQIKTPSLQPSDGQDGALVPISDHQTDLLPVNSDENLNAPNLLDVFEGKNTGVVSLGAVENMSDRLALIGGPQGFLQNMETKGHKPDVKTLTLLASTAEPGQLCLDTLLGAAKQHQIKLDLAFFNTLIHRAAKAGNMDIAEVVLSAMCERAIRVDVMTFGSLALGCKQKEDALDLLASMEEVGLRPNDVVFSGLIGCAVRRLDYIYLKKLVELMREKEVWPTEIIISQLEFAAQYPPNYDQYKRRNNYLVQIDGFRGYYLKWLQTMPAQTAEQAKATALQKKNKSEVGLLEAEERPSTAGKKFHSKNRKRAGQSAV